MAKPNLPAYLPEDAVPWEEPKVIEPNLTGVSFSFEACNINNFSAFRIVTIFIVDGQIVHVERSQPYATFEAIAKTEVLISGATWNLSARFKDGDMSGLGGEAVRELSNRLKVSDPALLKRIGPAIGIRE